MYIVPKAQAEIATKIDLSTIQINTPTNTQQFYACTRIPITATASDPDGTVAKVEFFRGQYKLAEFEEISIKHPPLQLPMDQFRVFYKPSLDRCFYNKELLLIHNRRLKS
jgi:hypothetical protein